MVYGGFRSVMGHSAALETLGIQHVQVQLDYAVVAYYKCLLNPVHVQNWSFS